MRKFTIFILFLLSFFVLPTSLNAQGVDIGILKPINHVALGLKPVSVGLSESAAYISLSTPIIIGAYGAAYGNEDLMKDAFYIALASGVNLLATYGLKQIIVRPRPAITYPSDIDPYKDLKSLSMPSGHTSGAFSTATALTLKYPEWYVAVPAFTWATAVGFSRMHLGVHYPSDVLAGAALGAGSAYLTYLLNEWLWNNYDIKHWKVIKKH